MSCFLPALSCVEAARLRSRPRPCAPVHGSRRRSATAAGRRDLRGDRARLRRAGRRAVFPQRRRRAPADARRRGGPTSPPRPAAAEKQRIVSEFYDDVAAQRYLQAYQLLSADLQHEQPYDDFIHRYDGVQRFEVQSTDEPGTARAHVTVVVHRAGMRTTGLAGEVTFAYDASNARWIIGERHLARQWGPALGAVATPQPVAACERGPESRRARKPERRFAARGGLLSRRDRPDRPRHARRDDGAARRPVSPPRRRRLGHVVRRRSRLRVPRAPTRATSFATENSPSTRVRPHREAHRAGARAADRHPGVRGGRARRVRADRVRQRRAPVGTRVLQAHGRYDGDRARLLPAQTRPRRARGLQRRRRSRRHPDAVDGAQAVPARCRRLSRCDARGRRAVRGQTRLVGAVSLRGLHDRDRACRRRSVLTAVPHDRFDAAGAHARLSDRARRRGESGVRLGGLGGVRDGEDDVAPPARDGRPARAPRRAARAAHDRARRHRDRRITASTIRRPRSTRRAATARCPRRSWRRARRNARAATTRCTRSPSATGGCSGPVETSRAGIDADLAQIDSQTASDREQLTGAIARLAALHVASPDCVRKEQLDAADCVIAQRGTVK